MNYKYLTIFMIALLFLLFISIYDPEGINLSKEIINRKEKFSVKEVEVEEDVPKNIIQTYKNKESVPSYVFDNIKSKNPNWNYHFYGDDECIEFLSEHFGQDFVDKFNEFKLGEHKSDLFRLCWLYIYGGVYADIDIEFFSSLDAIYKKSNFTMPFTYHKDLITKVHKRPLNALVIGSKGNKMIKKCILNIMKITQKDLENKERLILYVLERVLEKNKFEFLLEEKKVNNVFSIYYKDLKICNSRYEDFKNHKFII